MLGIEYDVAASSTLLRWSVRSLVAQSKETTSHGVSHRQHFETLVGQHPYPWLRGEPQDGRNIAMERWSKGTAPRSAMVEIDQHCRIRVEISRHEAFRTKPTKFDHHWPGMDHVAPILPMSGQS